MPTTKSNVVILWVRWYNRFVFVHLDGNHSALSKKLALDGSDVFSSWTMPLHPTQDQKMAVSGRVGMTFRDSGFQSYWVWGTWTAHTSKKKHWRTSTKEPNRQDSQGPKSVCFQFSSLWNTLRETWIHPLLGTPWNASSWNPSPSSLLLPNTSNSATMSHACVCVQCIWFTLMCFMFLFLSCFSSQVSV